MSFSYPWLDATWQQLRTQLNSARFSHSVLIHTQTGTGIEQVSSYLAQTLLCEHGTDEPCGQCQSCRLFAASSHPALLTLGNEESIKIEQIRALNSWVSKTPKIGQTKVVILQHVGSLTSACANALLKTLEEPQGNTHFILLNYRPSQVLPTIVSRCIQLTQQTPTLDAFYAWLGINGSDQAQLAYAFAAGAPLTAKALLSEPNSLDDFTHALNGVQQQPEALIEQLAKSPERINWLSQSLFLLIKAKQLGQPCLPALQGLASILSFEQLHTTYQSCLKLCSMQQQGLALNLAQQLYPVVALLTHYEE